MNGTKKFLVGVAVVVFSAAVLAMGSHVVSGDVHEDDRVKTDRVKRVLEESDRLRRIEDKLDRLLDR